MSAAFGVACAAASLALAFCARARAAELTLQGPAPAGCDAVTDLPFRVERALGRPMEPAEGPHFVVSVEPARVGFGARLEVSDTAGQRTFTAPTCDELIDTVALAIALAIGALPDVAPLEPDGSTPVVATPDPALAPAPPAPGQRDAARPEELSEPGPAFAGMAWVVADTGSLPAPGLGVAVGAELAWSALGLRAIGTLLPEREGNVDTLDPASPGGAMGLVTGSLLACTPVAVNLRAVALAACAGWELGQLSGRGTHVGMPHQKRTLWSAARLDLAARWSLPLGSLGVELLITAAAPLTRDEFILKDIDSVHRPASVVGRASVGLGWVMEK